jgi:predicted dinucleotide-binding enzyme
VGGGARHGSLRAAAEFGDVVLAALPYGAGEEVVRDLSAPLMGKVLLDCSNPVGPGFRLLTDGGQADPPVAAEAADMEEAQEDTAHFRLAPWDLWA